MTLYTVIFHPSILFSPPVTDTGLDSPPFMIGLCPNHIVCARCGKPYCSPKPLKLLLLLYVLILNRLEEQHSLLAYEITHGCAFNTIS